MKRKQKILSSAIMTLLGGTAISFSASAAINLQGDATTAGEVATYASEISVTSDLTYKLPAIQINLGGPVAVDSAANTVAVPSAETRYARFTLENATIGTSTPYIAGGALSVVAATGAIEGGTTHCPLVSEQGQESFAGVGTANLELADGGPNKTYVTFAIKSGATAASDTTGMLSAGCTISVDLQSIKVTNPGQPVKLTYGLFSGPIAAANNTIADTRGMNKQDVTVVQFAPALVFKTNTVGKDAVPSVATQFKLFKQGETNTSADQKEASAGAFDFTVANPNVLTATGASITTANTLLQTTTKLRIDGDFAGIRATGTDSYYYLSSDSSCGTTSASGTPDYGTNLSTLLSSVPLSVSFDLTDATTLTAANSSGTLFFCLGLGGLNPTPFDLTKAEGVAIPDSSSAFKITLVPAAAEGYTIGSKTEQLKAIKRDGVTLEAPFINIAPGYSSRIMLAHYNKNASADAPFFITIRGYDGEPQPTLVFQGKDAAGANLPVGQGLLKKGTTQKIMSTTLFSVPEGAKTHVGVSVNFHASNDDVQGVVQHINSTTGEVTSIPMIRPGGGRQ